MTPTWLQSQTTVFLVTLAGLVALLLLIIWWRERSRRWGYGLALALALAGLFTWSAGQLFEVPDYLAGCPELCAGWRGYPVPTALSTMHGTWTVSPIGLGINFLFHGLLLLLVAALWSAAERNWRLPPAYAWRKVLLITAVVVGLWSLIPRYAVPPEPAVRGDAQRLGINAKRLAARALGGLDWRIQRLALEDVRRLPQRSQPDAPGLPPPTGPEWRVCLRSYTFFYVPWRRVYIDLDATGALTIGGGVLPLDQECWSAPFPESPYPFAVGQPVP